MQSIANDEIVGVFDSPADPVAATQAVEAARVTLEDYLDRTFVDEATRFSDRGVADLLTPGTAALMTDESRAALGLLDLAPVAFTATGPASAQATVSIDGVAVLSVALTYEAALSVAYADGTAGPLVQRGTVVFVSTDVGWRASAVDVTLDRPDLTAPIASEGS